MIRRISFLCVLSLACAVAASASDPPAPRNVDLTAPDGIKLKATFFSAREKPAPGVLLLHQCNQQRKNWDDLAARLVSLATRRGRIIFTRAPLALPGRGTTST